MRERRLTVSDDRPADDRDGTIEGMEESTFCYVVLYCLAIGRSIMRLCDYAIGC